MKLINKLQRHYFKFSLLFLGSAILLAFFIIRLFIYNSAIDRLRYQKEVVIEQIESGEFPIFKNVVDIFEIPMSMDYTEKFSDTTIYEIIEGQFVPYKQIKFSQVINEKKYLISIRQPVNDAAQLLINVVEGMLGLFVILVVILIIFNRRINKKLWKNFYLNLETMKNYNLSNHDEIILKSTDVDEFNDLNEVVKRMAEQIKQDYTNLKEFTENASHEIHTPLAIIKSKIDLLIQSENLSEDQIKQLITINNSASRLARLNQSLMLLTKIENKQFKGEKSISLKEIIERQYEELSELASIRELCITKQIENDINLQINPDLAEILIRNLFTNAIRYCEKKGIIKIQLSKNEISFTNSGERLSIPSEKLFERFKKNVQESDSLGLGLAIVKSICTVNNLKIIYEYSENNHIFRVIV